MESIFPTILQTLTMVEQTSASMYLAMALGHPSISLLLPALHMQGLSRVGTTQPVPAVQGWCLLAGWGQAGVCKERGGTTW